MTDHSKELGEVLASVPPAEAVQLVSVATGQPCDWDCGLNEGVCPKCGREWHLVRVEERGR